MPFQFMCPQGHLLEGHESQMGQQVQCPLCGTLLIVPVVGPSAAAGPPPLEYPQAPGAWPGVHPGAPQTYGPEAPPVIEPFPVIQEPPASQPPPAAEPEPEPEEQEPKTVRILCPNGHELHTPMEMIGMQAACPECNAEFLLRYEDSLEYIEKKKAAREKRDQAFNEAALKWSIAAAVIVFVALVTMMVLASMR